MPELPDVEGFRRTLDGVAGQRIARVEVRDAGVLRGVSARTFARRLEGHRLAHPYRHGKWLIAPTEDGGPVVVLHFGMTGGLLSCPAGRERHPHDRVVLVLDDGGELRYRDQRKLQGLRLGGPGTAEEATAGLGPDAMSVGAREFGEVLAGRRGRVKAVLIDQSAVAGLGNLLADEILWRSRVHPARPAREVTAGERRRMHGEMRRVLRPAVRAGRVPDRPDWLTGRRDRPEPDCPRCGTKLRGGRIAGRHTVWCPHCQPADGPDR
jgi:formamidopyrimidine-DNA glycosylase